MKFSNLDQAVVLAGYLSDVRVKIKAVNHRNQFYCTINGRMMDPAAIDHARPAVTEYLRKEEHRLERELIKLGVYDTGNKDDVSAEDEPVYAPTDCP